MADQLDGVYVSQRLRLASLVAATAAGALLQLRHEREQAIEATVRVVEAGQAQVVALVDGYMAAKLAQARRGDGQPKGLDLARYTVSTLRRRPAVEVYERPFGALGGQLEAGADVSVAIASADASVRRLALTDLQLAQTHAARDWMADDQRIVGYRRVLGSGHSCALCTAASTRTYKREDLAPIHERCSCTVSPVFDPRANPTSPADGGVRVAKDPELGPRLLEESWAA
jgi:hypothetical protein